MSKLCEDKLCDDKLCDECGGRRKADGSGRRRRDTEPKTRTPHKDVGNEPETNPKSILNQP